MSTIYGFNTLSDVTFTSLDEIMEYAMEHFPEEMTSEEAMIDFEENEIYEEPA